MSAWAKGPVCWTDESERTAFVSVAFTWDMHDAYQSASFYRALGYRVRVGGPGCFAKTPAREAVKEFAELGGSIEDAVVRHNPDATFASRGCPVGCWFCIVPAMEGRNFTLIDDFPVRPILCDNNLSALPLDFQRHVVSRYRAEGIPLLDANSGFEPRTFNEEVLSIWEPVNRGPWRFACDDQGDVPYVREVLKMLAGVRQKRKRVYVLIGNEPFENCMDRIRIVLDLGGEPHAQPVIKLNATEKKPWIKFDWTEQLLRDVARWCNRFLWQYCTFEEYDRIRERNDRSKSGQVSTFPNPPSPGT